MSTEETNTRKTFKDFTDYLETMKRVYKEIRQSGQDVFIVRVVNNRLLYHNIHLALLPLKDRLFQENGSVEIDENDKISMPDFFKSRLKDYGFFPIGSENGLRGHAKLNLDDLLKLREKGFVGIHYDERIDPD